MRINIVKKSCIEILKKHPNKEFTSVKLSMITGFSIRCISYNMNQICKMDIGFAEAYKTNGNLVYSLGYYYDDNPL